LFQRVVSVNKSSTAACSRNIIIANNFTSH
jgi:hypothetical protein